LPEAFQTGLDRGLDRSTRLPVPQKAGPGGAMKVPPNLGCSVILWLWEKHNQEHSQVSPAPCPFQVAGGNGLLL